MQQLNNRPQKERGATLIVALIMLILLSLIGVTSLRGAATAEKMSAADLQKSVTFQASESAAILALRDETNISKAIKADAPTAANPVDIGSTITTTQVTFTPVGVGAVLGASLGPGGFASQRIMVTSSAQLTTDTNVESSTVHGVVRLVPGI